MAEEKSKKPRQMVRVQEDPHDSSSYKEYPLKPSFFERVKEAFTPGSNFGTGPSLEAIRKKRLKYNDTSSSDDE